MWRGMMRVLGRNGVITATFPKKCEMRLPLWSWRPLRPRWSYTSANAELALNGLLRFGTALCTSVFASTVFSKTTLKREVLFVFWRRAGA